MSEFLNSINNVKPDTSWETEARSFEAPLEPAKAATLPEETPAVEAEAPVAAAEAETPEAAAVAPEVPDDEVQKVVPLKALQEERRQNRELSDRLAQIEQMMRTAAQPQEQPKADDQGPDPETDPIGALKWERAQRVALQAETLQRQQVEQLRNTYRGAAAQFAAKTPDFKDAYNFAIQARAKQLAISGYNPQAIAQAIDMEELQLAATALQNGKDPAQTIYEFAESYGYKKAASAPAAAAVAPAAPLDAAAAATLQKAKAAASTSISSGGKPPKADFDPSSLANLYGAAFDAAWEKMAKQSGSRSSMFRE